MGLSLQKTIQLLVKGYPPLTMGNHHSWALWQMDPTWWNAHRWPSWWRSWSSPATRPGPWRSQQEPLSPKMKKMCELLLFDAIFFWMKKVMIQVMKKWFKLPKKNPWHCVWTYICVKINCFGRRGELIKIFRVAPAWTFSSSIPMKRSFSAWISHGISTGVGKCPMTWVYWTSPYSSHYRPYTDHGWVMWNMGTFNETASDSEKTCASFLVEGQVGSW